MQSVVFYGKSTLPNLEVTISRPVKVIQQPIKNN